MHRYLKIFLYRLKRRSTACVVTCKNRFMQYFTAHEKKKSQTKKKGNEFCTEVILVLLYKVVYLFLRGGFYCLEKDFHY